jgi:hypothetical protein
MNIMLNTTGIPKSQDKGMGLSNIKEIFKEEDLTQELTKIRRVTISKAIKCTICRGSIPLR